MYCSSLKTGSDLLNVIIGIVSDVRIGMNEKGKVTPALSSETPSVYCIRVPGGAFSANTL